MNGQDSNVSFRLFLQIPIDSVDAHGFLAWLVCDKYHADKNGLINWIVWGVGILDALCIVGTYDPEGGRWSEPL